MEGSQHPAVGVRGDEDDSDLQQGVPKGKFLRESMRTAVKRACAHVYLLVSSHISGILWGFFFACNTFEGILLNDEPV